MAKKETRPFGIRDKLAYAAGDLGCNMSFALKSTVQIFWLVFMAMETEVLAVLLLIVQIWDAVNDPILGTMIDRDTKKYKYGKFKTYIFIGACGLLVGGAAVFLPFPNADLWVKCVLFIVGYMIWDAFYTIANVPYGSLLGLISYLTAEHFVNGAVIVLTLDIPHCLLDTADCRHHKRTASVKSSSVQRLNMMFNLHGVFSD